MASKTTEVHEQAIGENFVRLFPGPALRVVEHRDKPDLVIEAIDTGDHFGVEVVKVLRGQADGRDWHLESVARAGVLAACEEMLGPSGSVDARINKRPRDPKQVKRYLVAFREHLREIAETILAEGIASHGVFPAESLYLARVGPKVVEMFGGTPKDVAAAERHLKVAEDLDWLHIMRISVSEGDRGWHAYGFPGGDHIADRHRKRKNIGRLILDAIEKKCDKAEDYDKTHPLWLLLYNPFKAQPGVLARRIARLPGIERFSQVWMLSVPLNVMDAERPPTVRCLFDRTAG